MVFKVLSKIFIYKKCEIEFISNDKSSENIIKLANAINDFPLFYEGEVASKTNDNTSEENLNYLLIYDIILQFSDFFYETRRPGLLLGNHKSGKYSSIFYWADSKIVIYTKDLQCPQDCRKMDINPDFWFNYSVHSPSHQK